MLPKRIKSVVQLRIYIIMEMKQKANSKVRHSGRQQEKAAKLLDVYIRNNKKQAILIHTQQNTSHSHIANVINAQFRVPPNQQILFYNGQQLRSNSSDETFRLEDKSIIHLVDRRNVQQEITINIRRLNIPKIQQHRISSSEIIEDFIVRNIADSEADKMFLVYTGRELNARNSFAEEFVETDSELFCLHQTRDQVTGQRREKYQKKIGKEKTHKKQKSQRTEDIITDNCKQESNETMQKKVRNIQTPKVPVSSSQEAKIFKQDEIQSKEQKYPNFKKKKQSEEVNLGNTQPPFHPTNSHMEHTSSLITEQNFQQNKYNLGQSQFFNEESNISSIIADQHHNPQSNKRDQGSLMFQSVCMGLNNESSLANTQHRPPTADILNQIQENSSQASEEKLSFNFQTRAPEMIHQPDQQLTKMVREEIAEVNESKQQCSESKEVKQKDDSKSKEDPFNEGSQFLMEQIEQHRLSNSAEMGVDLEDDSPLKQKDSSHNTNRNNAILIEDQENNEQKIDFIGVEIEPIAHSTHTHSPNGQIFAPMHINTDHVHIPEEKEVEIQTPCFHSPNQFDLYLIQQEQQPQIFHSTPSEMVEEKDEVETNGRGSGSQAYSRNSSRVRRYNPQSNEYQFGQYEKLFDNTTHNRMSGCREVIQKDPESPLLQTSQSQIYKTQKYNYFPENEAKEVGACTKKCAQDEQSFHVVDQPPPENRVKDSSSLLIGGYSKIIENPVLNDERYRHIKQNRFQLAKQISGIDELSNLFSNMESKQPVSQHSTTPKPIDHRDYRLQVQSPKESLEKVELGKQDFLQSLQSMYRIDRTREKQFYDIKMQKKPSKINENGELLVDTSLNQRMTVENKPFRIDSPVMMNGIRGLIESIDSLERMDVKILASNNRASSQSLTTTNNKDYYNIGDYVYNCEFNAFDPLEFYFQRHSHMQLEIAKSYP